MIWIITVFAIMKFQIAPFNIFFELLKDYKLNKPTFFISDILGFVFGLLIIFFAGYLFSLLTIKKAGSIERFLASICMGFGTNSWLMIILGLLFNLKLSTITFAYVVFLILLLILTKWNYKKIKIENFRLKNNIWIILFIIPFVLFSLFHDIFFPELYTDSIIYGIELSKIIFKEKRIPFIAGGPSVGLEFSANYPPGFQLIIVFLYSFIGNENVIYAKILSTLCLILLLFFVYNWSKELFKKEIMASISVLLLITTPFVILHSRFSFLYLYLMLQFSLGFYYLYKFNSTGERNHLIASLFFGSFASLTSYLGLLYFPFMVFILASKNINIKKLLIFVIIPIILISPWYIRNFILLGNPLWPFGGGKYIDSLIVSANTKHFIELSKLIGFNYDTAGDFAKSLKYLFFSYVDFFDSTKSNGFRPYLTIFTIPAIFIWFKKRESRFEFFVVWFLYILLVYMFIINFFERYFSLAIIPAIILSIYLINNLYSEKIFRTFLIVILAIIYVNSLFLSFIWDECIGAEKKDVISYMRSLGNYDKILDICYKDDAKMWKWVNENVSEKEKIATTDVRWYYFNKTMIDTDSWQLKDLYYANNTKEIRDILKKNGINFILINVAKRKLDVFDGFELVVKFGNNELYKVL